MDQEPGFQFERCDDYHEGVALVRVGGLYGYLDRRGKWVAEPLLDDGWFFSEGMAAARWKNLWGYVEKSGRLLFWYWECASHFQGGLAPVKKGGKWGCIDRLCQIVIEPRFSFISGFHAKISLARTDGPYGFIDRTGKWVLAPRFEGAGIFSEGMCSVTYGGCHGYVNDLGRLVIEPRFEAAWGFHEGLAAVQLKGKWGYINQDGDLVVRPCYDYAGPFGEGLAQVGDWGKKGNFLTGAFGFVDQQGEVAIPIKLYRASGFREGLALVARSESSPLAFIDRQGHSVIELAPDVKQAYSFSEGLARIAVRSDARQPLLWGYLNQQGEVAIPAAFEMARDFKEGRAWVAKGGRWGCINRRGAFAF
jgi:hypothetical protein